MLRSLMEKVLKDQFDDGELTNQEDEEITDFAAEVLALSDEDFLALYDWTISFQG